MALRAMRKTKIPAFGILLKYDTDSIFIASSLISNLYWIVIVGSGISIVKFVLAFFNFF